MSDAIREVILQRIYELQRNEDETKDSISRGMTWDHEQHANRMKRVKTITLEKGIRQRQKQTKTSTTLKEDLAGCVHPLGGRY